MREPSFPMPWGKFTREAFPRQSKEILHFRHPIPPVAPDRQRKPVQSEALSVGSHGSILPRQEKDEARYIVVPGLPTLMAKVS